MRAVAKAHRRTGAPITVHTHPGTPDRARGRSGCSARRGCDPRRVVLGHSGDTTDVDHLSELADAGFLLGMDRFGINLDTTFEARADTVVEMCRRGYAEQHGAVPGRVLLHRLARPERDGAARRSGTTCTSTTTCCRTCASTASPTSRSSTMLVANPRRYFENVGTLLMALTRSTTTGVDARRRTASSATSTCPLGRGDAARPRSSGDPDAEAVVELDGPRLTYRELWDARGPGRRRPAGGRRRARRPGRDPARQRRRLGARASSAR